MEIDWVTVAAQAVNFLVLVWLLQRVLYGPITRAMARREDRIAARLADAARARGAAEEEAEALKAARADLERDRDAILEEARAEARALKAHLDSEARAAAAEERKSWHAEVERDRQDFLDDLRRAAAQHIHQLARDVLRDLADADLNARVAERFIEKLSGVEPAVARRLARAVASDGGKVRIESAFDLPQTVRSRITRAVHMLTGTKGEVVYATAPDLLMGVRLQADGQSVEWTLAAHLDRLEDAVNRTLGGQSPETAPPDGT
ncbi:MAG: F0F1 ATP synthase subunit delta [Alphaproteobacteria bacterium]|nr:F0F1 ATP synthase subunit delta [Alphaproteobacteria bacterium]MDX5370087.1 F0F1 ATP synthase subunit delta [Alphaproteobacteria bacterium]MDX5464664.1 F0F1 ATP synthase subunit delta [Alphaproteobacteria bacterium]